jgi:hypothetical protein
VAKALRQCPPVFPFQLNATPWDAKAINPKVKCSAADAKPFLNGFLVIFAFGISHDGGSDMRVRLAFDVPAHWQALALEPIVQAAAHIGICANQHDFFAVRVGS